jgi:transcriptional antiterminator RfaH
MTADLLYEGNSISRSNLQSWYAVHCKALRESQAAAALESYLRLAVYLPEIRRRSRRQVQRVALFPGYLFVQANLQEVGLSTINATPGVVRLVAFDETPQPIPETTIEAIRELVDSFNARGGQPEHGFRPGDIVRFKGGALQGLKAIFAGPMKPSERVRVLIDFLGSCREAEINVGLLERASSEPIAGRERRTRGRGRKIRSQ